LLESFYEQSSGKLFELEQTFIGCLQRGEDAGNAERKPVFSENELAT
jgi:hypothetical protein